MTDDEIMAAALRCPESEKVPLKVGDRVIALEDFLIWGGPNKIKRGMMGVVDRSDYSTMPWHIDWGLRNQWWANRSDPIGKLVPRKKEES